MPIAINPACAALELERILASPGFSNAPKLQALLRYLVEKTLSGEGERLKGYTIGLDVFVGTADQADRLVAVDGFDAGRQVRRGFPGWAISLGSLSLLGLGLFLLGCRRLRTPTTVER